MKTFRKLSIFVLAVIAVLSLTLFAACNDEEVPDGGSSTITSDSTGTPADSSAARKFTVEFESNGGTPAQTLTVDENSEYTLPAVTRAEYDFLGWYVNSDLTGTAYAAGTKRTATTNVKYYAGWELIVPKYAVTLNVAGGALPTTQLNLKEGAIVYDAVKDLKPTKSGYEFGAWYYNGEELSHNMRMGTTAITLTAAYKTQYTVELWQQKLSQDGYEKAETLTFYEYEGKTVSYEERVTGFVQVNNDAAVTTLTVGSDPAANVLKYYYDRETYRLTYNSNYTQYEADLTNLTEEVTVVYGQEVEVPENLFDFEGYYMLGWATTQSGDVTYNTYYLNNNIFNDDSLTAKENDKISPVKNTVLYAKWYKGYKDMFGGGDYLFRFAAGWDIYLNRGGVFFLGEYDENRNKFTFYDSKDNIIVTGKLNSNGTFCYTSDVRAGFSAILYKATGLDNNVKIYFDDLNGIQYSVMGETGTTEVSEGTYTINDDGEYVVTYATGALKGTTMTMTVGTYTSGNNAINVFKVRNDEEYDMPELVRYAIYDGNLTFYLAYQMKFDGYGSAKYYTAQNHETFVTLSYAYNEETGLYDLTYSGQEVGSVKLMDIKVSTATKGFMFFGEEYAHEFVGEDGSTLLLDGYMNATYTNGTTVQTGYYSVDTTETAFGDAIIDFYPKSGNACKFIVNTITSAVESNNGESNSSVSGEGESGEGETSAEEVTEYKQVMKNADYAEYYFHFNKSVYYGPLFVFDGDEDNTVYVYNYLGNDTYELALKGTCVQNGNDYVLTVTETFLYEADSMIGDLNRFKSICFSLDVYTMTSSSGVKNYVSVHYWHSYTDYYGGTFTTFELEGSDGSKTTYVLSETYTSEGNGTVTVEGGFLTYEINGNTYIDQYESSGNYYRIETDDDVYVIFELNAEDHTFEIIESLPYNATVAVEGLNTKDTMAFDGKGGATYTAAVTDDNGQSTKKTYTGTVTKTGEESLTGYTVYTFQAEGLSFRFIQVYMSSSKKYYVFRASETYTGEYGSEDAGYLELDGYGFGAKYTDENGKNDTGIYYVSDENVVTFIGGNGDYRYFDLKGKTFTLRGDEYGTYLLYDNKYLDAVMFTLDGYGHATVKVYDNDSQEFVTADENGTYTIEGEEIFLSYTYGAAKYDYVFVADTYAYNGSTYNVLVARHKEIAYTFVSGNDWSVLKLDPYGNAVRHTTDGTVQEGTYLIVSDDMFYFVTADETDAAVYTYDVAKGEANKLQLSTRGYFTEDLEALLFSQYGFATFHNTERYYYNVDDYGEVTIYRRDYDNPEANEYGFIREDFGTFEDVITYEGKTYYANDGYRITFSRNTDNKDKYPVRKSSDDDTLYPLGDLVFAPNGEAEFAVSGVVYMQGNSYKATVVRELNEDTGEYEMYFVVGTYYMGITVNFKGVDPKTGEPDNHYSITSMKSMTTYYSYTYLYYAMMYAMYGYNVPDGWGTISMTYFYDEDGAVSGRRMNAQFGEYSGLFDYTGAPVSIDTDNYGYSSQGGYYAAEANSASDEDDYEYYLYFVTSNYGNTPCYRILAFTRTQEFEIGNTVFKVERLLYTENNNFTAGELWATGIFEKDDQGELKEVSVSGGFTKGGVYYYIVRTTDEDGNFTGSTYYYVEYTEAKAYSDSTAEQVQPFASVKITKEAVDFYYSADKAYFVEIDPRDSGLILGVNGDAGYSNYIVYETDVNGENDYEFVLSSGAEYSVKIVEGVAVVTERERVTYKRAEGDEENYFAFGDLTFVPCEEEEFKTRASVVIRNYSLRGYLVKINYQGEPMLYFYIEYPDYTYYFDVELTDGTDDQGNATHTYTIVGYEYQVNYYSLQYFTYVNQYGDTDDYWGKMHIGLDYDEKLEIQKAYLYYFQFGPYSSCYGYDLDFYDSDELEYDENGNVYSVALVDEDGQVYTLYLALDHEYGLYSIAALVKEQTLTVDGYELKVGTVEATDYSAYFAKGYVMTFDLYEVEGENKTLIEGDFYVIKDGTLMAWSRTADEDGKVTASYYYFVTFTKDANGNITACTVTKEAATLYYTEDGKTFAEFTASKAFVNVVTGGEDAPVESYVYDQTKDTYRVTLYNGVVYDLKIVDGKLVMGDELTVHYTRAEGDEENYNSLADILFVPDEGDEFTTSATVYWAGMKYDAIIQRFKSGDDYRTRLTVKVNDTYYNMLVDLSEKTDDQGVTTREFTVSAYEVIEYYVAFDYVYNMAANGYDGENTWGDISIIYVYDKEGKVTDYYSYCEFGKDMACTQIDGTAFAFSDEYTYYEAAANYYYVYFYGTDGLLYSLGFSVTYTNNYKTFKVMYASVYEKTVAGEYAVSFETIVYTNYPETFKLGENYWFRLYTVDGEDQTRLSVDDWTWLFDCDHVAVVYNYDENDKFVSTDYYFVTLTFDDEAATWFKPVKSASVTVKHADAYYTADGKSFVEIIPDMGVAAIYISGKGYEFVDECMYDATTETYTVTVDMGVYPVKIVDGVAVIGEDKRVTYVRAEGDEANYYGYTAITFLPDAADEYRVEATIYVGDTRFKGVLIRKKVVNGEDTYYETYFTVNDYVVYVTLTDGTDGEGTVTRTFTVTGISEYVTYSDSNYLLATLMQGYTGNNVWGEICVRYDFDENGEVEDTSLDYAFVSTGVSETVTNKDGNMIVSLPGRTLIEYDEDEKMYYLQFAASDGINYCMYVNLYSNTQYAYYVVHIVVRYHYFEVGDTAFCMGVTLFSDDPKYEVGYLYINSISEGDAEYWIPDYAFRLEIDGSIYYPVRTFDENDVETAVTYYYINVTLDDQATAPVYVMKSVTFTKEACNVYYSADGKSVFEISPTKGVLLATVDGFTDEYVNSSKYDEQTATYTVYVDAGIFTLKIVNGVAETEMIWDGKTITVDVSGITYFAEADAECYIYVWYKDGTNNGDFPGQKMTKGENGKYTYVANGKAIAGVKISRCSPTDGTVWNETGDITTFNDAHEIVVTEMHQPALS